jgi:hypothetical protein
MSALAAGLVIARKATLGGIDTLSALSSSFSRQSAILRKTAFFVRFAFAALSRFMRPAPKPALRPESRDALLTAIAKAGGWVNEIRLGRIPARAGLARTFFGMRSGGERWIWPGCPGGGRRVRTLAKDQS